MEVQAARLFAFLGIATLDDELIRVAPLAGLLTFELAPWSLEVLAATTGFGTTFTTTVRVIDWVHTHTTDGWANAEPTGATSFAADHIHVLRVADDADGGVAISVNLTDFTGGQFHEGVVAFAVVQGDGLTSSAGNATTAADDEFHIVDARSERDVAEWQCVSEIRSGFRAGAELGSDLEAVWCEDVGEGAIIIFQKSNPGRAVWIILDPDDSSGAILLAAFEVDDAVFLLMTTADVAHGDDPLIVPATGALAHFEEGLLGFGLGDFIESWERLVTVDRSDGSEGFERHGKVLRLKIGFRGGLSEFDFFAIFETNNSLFPFGGCACIGAAFTAGFAVVLHGANSGNFLAEDLLHSLFDLELVGFWIDFEHVFVVRFAEQGGLFAEADGVNHTEDVLHGK